MGGSFSSTSLATPQPSTASTSYQTLHYAYGLDFHSQISQNCHHHPAIYSAHKNIGTLLFDHGRHFSLVLATKSSEERDNDVISEGEEYSTSVTLFLFVTLVNLDTRPITLVLVSLLLS